MLYRSLTPDDLPAVADYAIAGMRVDLYPALRLVRGKVEALVRHFTKPNRDFHLVAFDEQGRVAGAIAAVVADMLFFEWCEAHVVMCRATTPGVGRRLIAALREWAQQQPHVRRVLFPQEFHAPRAMGRLLRMHGFEQQITTGVFYKG